MAAITAIYSSDALAQLVQPFTSGNLAICRVGDGINSEVNNGSPVFLDEYTTNGSLVQSVPLPTSKNGSQWQLLLSGVASSEGGLNQSLDGRYLLTQGYGTNAGGASLSGTTSTNVPRVIARVDGYGNIDTSTALTNWTSGNNPRSVISLDGSAFWGAGGAGVVYAPFGYTNAVALTNKNARVIGIFTNSSGNQQIYISSSSGGTLLATVGTGLPTTINQAVANIPGTLTVASPYGFVFATLNGGATPDTLYVADDTASTGGLIKYALVGGNWTAKGTNLLGTSIRGLTATISGTTVTLYATTGGSGATGGGTLYKYVDTAGYNAAPSGTSNTLATAANNMAFRGVAFAPTATLTAAAPAVSSISPASQTLGSGSTATFTLTGTTGNPIASNNWYKVVSGVSTNLIAGQHGAALTLTNVQPTDSAGYFAILTNASGSATSSVVTLTVQNTGPIITGISPTAYTNAAGSPASFTVTASGTTPFSYFWYKEIPGTGSNLIASATNATLSFAATLLTDAASYQVVVSNAYAPNVATSSVVSLVVTSAPPVITGIGPASITTNVGFNVSFTVTNSGTPPFGYLWYKEIPGVSTNLISGATNATLVLSSVLGGSAANYQAVVTNAANSAGVTSSVVSLTVTGDPTIAVQPANTYGLISNRVEFAVGVLGTSPNYQWHFTDAAGNPIGSVVNGTQADGSVISGANSGVLTIDNVQANEQYTNFNVTVQTAYGGPITSSNATLLTVGYTNVLAFWDFNGPEFTNYTVNPSCTVTPAPFIGVGSALAVGTAYSPGPYPQTSSSFSPFSGSVDPNNGNGFESYPAYAYAPGYPAHTPPFSWGTSQYPTNGNPALNKTAGVQFNVSTVGAKNIQLYYESRFSGTASLYERLQYTTDGITWIDYPTSSTWTSTAITWYPFNYNFTGFSGVANNPNFGVRVVSEYQSTATYGVSGNTNFVGAANTYGTSGTLTYDVVTFSGAAITNNNVPPILTVGFANTNMLDYVPTNIGFTVTAGTTPADNLSYSAVSLNASAFNPTFAFSGSGANRILTITPNSIAASVAAAPILITATDANGDSAVTWFDVTVGTVNLPPTNSLTQLSQTNILANTALVIPFSVGDDRTAVGGLTYAVSSGNNTVIPAGNISIGNQGTASPTLNILPGTNQLGVGTVSVTVYDNDTQAPKSTTAVVPVMVRPNTNIVAVDYFNYDNSGALDAVSSGFWQHLTGNYGQMHVGGGVVTVDTKNNTENLQTALLGAPYRTNSASVLYCSFMVNLADTANMPINNGTYFACFNDGSGNTANVEGLVVVATNGVATPGDYRLGIANPVGANGTNAQMFAQDLSPNVNYVVVASLVLTNGQSTLWVSPSGPSSPSVTDTSSLSSKYNITQFELRESGGTGGAVSVSYLKVGTTFDSVFPSLHVSSAGSNVIVNWSDPTLAVQATTNLLNPFTDLVGATPPYTNNASTTNTLFLQFKH